MHDPSFSRRIMKAQIADEPVVLTYPEKLEAQAREQSENIIEDAQRASERIRRAALQAAEKERMAARKEAADLIEKAKAERAAFFQETFEAAKSEAESKVLEEFRPRVESSVREMEELVRTTEAAMKECLEKHKGEIVDLAVRIAEKVLLRQAQEDRDLVYRTACAALSQARERQELTIYVHPDDLCILKQYEMDLIARFDDLKTIKMEIDRRVDRGGVRIETPSGLIDARIRTQIDEIMKCVLGDLPPDTD